MNQTPFDQNRWKQKAMAFVTRSHRHLWGKNNEDPQAFLYTRGLKNTFIKEQLLGWNKFGQNRPMQNWGLVAKKNPDEKLLLTPGIVIPYIINKKLTSVFIYSYSGSTPGRTKMTPGSACSTILLGKPTAKMVVIRDPFDGLFLFQELKDTFCIVVHPDLNIPFDPVVASTVKQSARCVIASSNTDEACLNHEEFGDISDKCFYTYPSKEKLIKDCLKKSNDSIFDNPRRL